MNRPNVTARAFSLAEVIVVTAIVLILVGLVTSATVYARRSAEYSVCTSNFQQILKATELYRSDYDACLPRFNPGGFYSYGPNGIRRRTADLLGPYLRDRSVYFCRAAKEPRPFPVDYEFRYVIDLSEFNRNRTWPWRVDPHPTTVLVWDSHHLKNRPGFVDEKDVWLFGRADTSVGRTTFGNIRKTYWQADGTWSQSVADTSSFPMQYVFPGEEWPPGLYEMKRF